MQNARDRQANGVRRIAEGLAERLQTDLALKVWDGTTVPLGKGASGDVAFAIRSPAAVRRLILSPKLTTFLELFATGDIDVEGGSLLTALRRIDHHEVRRAARGLDKRMLARSLWPFLLLRGKELHAPRAYRDTGEARADRGRDDRRMVQFHYDVSNAFFALFLDDQMTYSCAYFERPDMSLEEAQQSKLDMTCRRLRLQPGERFLDVGCGWGGLICYAAQNYGVNALGVTLSKQQFEYAQARVQALGLSDRVKVELRDYREVAETGQRFDKVSQVELFEHIGVANHDAHFKTLHRLLKPRGLYLHHSCTRRLTRDPKKFKSSSYHDLMRSFVFPGTELDHIGATLAGLERNGFEVHDVENWREHFLKTAEAWEAHLSARKDAAEALVGKETTRLWLLFFTLFAMALERGACLIFQTLASRRGVGPSPVPPTRSDLYLR